MGEPRTEAGRRLLGHVGVVAWFDAETEWAAWLASIEAEAIAAYAADLRAKVEGLLGEPCRGGDVCDVHSELLFGDHCEDWSFELAAVLALLDPERSQP